MGIEEYGGGQQEHSDVLVVTTNDVPGYDVQRVIGEVFGLTVLPQALDFARPGETPTATWAARSAPA